MKIEFLPKRTNTGITTDELLVLLSQVWPGSVGNI